MRRPASCRMQHGWTRRPREATGCPRCARLPSSSPAARVPAGAIPLSQTAKACKGFNHAVHLHQARGAVEAKQELWVQGLAGICERVQDHQRGTGNQTDGCWRKEQRRAGAGLVPQGADVGAVRVSAGGWEGWVLEGLQASAPLTARRRLTRIPHAVLLHALRGCCWNALPLKLQMGCMAALHGCRSCGRRRTGRRQLSSLWSCTPRSCSATAMPEAQRPFLTGSTAPDMSASCMQGAGSISLRIMLTSIMLLTSLS